MFNHVTHNIHETFQWQHFFKNEWSHVLLPNTGWNHISVMALGKLTCKANIVHFSIKTLDTWSLVVKPTDWVQKKGSSSSSYCFRLFAPTGFDLPLPWCLSALAMSFPEAGTTASCLQVEPAFKWLKWALDGSSWVNNTCPIASERRWADGCTLIVPSDWTTEKRQITATNNN